MGASEILEMNTMNTMSTATATAKTVVAYCSAWMVLDLEGTLYLEGPCCFAPLDTAVEYFQETAQA